jgi:hypothetical protein
MARKLSDQTVVNTILTDDSVLTFPVGANESWEFEMFILCTQSAANGLGLVHTIAVPTGATVTWTTQEQDLGGVAINNINSINVSGTTTTATIPNGGTAIIRIKGIVTNGSTAGNLKLQWMTSTAAKAVTVKANSFVQAIKF